MTVLKRLREDDDVVDFHREWKVTCVSACFNSSLLVERLNERTMTMGGSGSRKQ